MSLYNGPDQQAECMRSGKKCLASELVRDGRNPSLLVLPEWADDAHPQEKPFDPDDVEGVAHFPMAPENLPAVTFGLAGLYQASPIRFQLYWTQFEGWGPRPETYVLYRSVNGGAYSVLLTATIDYTNGHTVPDYGHVYSVSALTYIDSTVNDVSLFDYYVAAVDSIGDEVGTTNHVQLQNTVVTNNAPNVLPQDLTSGEDLQIFLANGTWTKPAGAKLVHVYICAGGGGGGSGRKGAPGTNRTGGAAGSGGGRTEVLWLASGLPDSIAVTVPGVATGGAPRMANSTDGMNGTTASDASFGTFAVARGGNGGLGGIAGFTTGTGAFGGHGQFNDGGSAGTGGGAAGTGTDGGSSGNGSGGGAPNYNFCLMVAPGGGGGGGGISSANTAGGWGASGIPQGHGVLYTGRPITESTNGFNILGGNRGMGYGGNGTGGKLSGVVPKAGNGGFPGAGGGGGGASVDSVNDSGAGGDGGTGVIIVTTYL